MLYKTKKSFEGNSEFRVLKMMAFFDVEIDFEEGKVHGDHVFNEVEEAIDVTLSDVS